MSDQQGAGWWQATDGKWYPPETHPFYRQQVAWYAQQQRLMARQERTHRMAHRAATGYVIGALIGLALTVAFAWWLVADVDFG